MAPIENLHQNYFSLNLHKMFVKIFLVLILLDTVKSGIIFVCFMDDKISKYQNLHKSYPLYKISAKLKNYLVIGTGKHKPQNDSAVSPLCLFLPFET